MERSAKDLRWQLSQKSNPHEQTRQKEGHDAETAAKIAGWFMNWMSRKIVDIQFCFHSVLELTRLRYSCASVVSAAEFLNSAPIAESFDKKLTIAERQRCSERVAAKWPQPKCMVDFLKVRLSRITHRSFCSHQTIKSGSSPRRIRGTFVSYRNKSNQLYFVYAFGELWVLSTNFGLVAMAANGFR